jgi:Raf kinase inhibitor-like YbhB/YbcL family protein
MQFTLTSSAFSHQGSAPQRYTCEGDDISPPLAWSGAPASTKSFVLIVDDPDAPDPRAPRMTWVHWVLYNLPAAAKALPEGVKDHALPAGTKEGRNDWKRTGYGGPCPPIGLRPPWSLAAGMQAARSRRKGSASPGHLRRPSKRIRPPEIGRQAR